MNWPLQDTGFTNSDAARRARRRLRLRAALMDVQSSVAALLDRLDEQSDANRDTIAATIQRGVELANGNVERGVGGDPIDLVKRQDVREKELLEGVDLVLQFLETLFDTLHSSFPAPATAPGRMTEAAGASSSGRGGAHAR